jgi:hypothetical protein
MPAPDDVKQEHRKSDCFDLAITSLIVNLGISDFEAAKVLLVEAARRMNNPAAVRAALKAK